MTEQILRDFLEGKLRGRIFPPCFMSLSCPSGCVNESERHPARDCLFFAICYTVRGRYGEYGHLIRKKGATTEELDKELQGLMDVAKEHGFDVNSPDCIGLANDIRRLMERRNALEKD